MWASAPTPRQLRRRRRGGYQPPAWLAFPTRPRHTYRGEIFAVGARMARLCRGSGLWWRVEGLRGLFASPHFRRRRRGAPLRRGWRSDGTVGADAFIGPHPPQASLFDDSTQATRLGCLRRGTFHRRKVPKMRRGLRPPVPRGAARRASPEGALHRQLRSSGSSRPILPAPSRLRAGQ